MPGTHMSAGNWLDWIQIGQNSQTYSKNPRTIGRTLEVADYQPWDMANQHNIEVLFKPILKWQSLVAIG